MERSSSRLAWILVPIGLAAVAIAGMWLFMSFAASAVHPGPQAISSVTQADGSPQWSEAVNGARRIIRAALVEQNLPGVSVAVGAGGRIGTASTVLPSAAVGLLLERHRLRLDDEIQAYVPQFPQKQWPVTRRQLMTLVGGVGTYAGDDGPLLRQRCERPVEALQQFAQGELLLQVSAAIEAAAAQPFLTFIGGQIFRPLGWTTRAPSPRHRKSRNGWANRPRMRRSSRSYGRWSWGRWGSAARRPDRRRFICRG